MTAYELMLKTNHYLIKGGTLNESQKQNIARQFLSDISSQNTVNRFHNSVNSPKVENGDSRLMYPLFFIPPYNNGKKFKTILGQMPKTQILSANMYELEIIRLLNILSPENEIVSDMTLRTLARLKTTCFGNRDDGLGECFDASLVVLRFLAVVTPAEIEWINSRIVNYNNHVDEKKRPWFAKWYFWLCLSELPFPIAEAEIMKYKSEIILWLTTKSCVMNSEQDKIIPPVILCILRNMLCRLEEYEYIKNQQPYVSEKDNRLHFDMI